MCGTSNETVADAEIDLPKNLCPLIKGTYGLAYTDKCPFTYFADMIIGETTCDGKKKMFELLSDIKEMHVLHLPQSQERPYAKKIWAEEIRILKERLEEKYGIEITEEQLRQAAHKRNYLRKVMCEMFEMQTNCPPPMKVGLKIRLPELRNCFLILRLLMRQENVRFLRVRRDFC